jgi:hypothetical protein
MTDYAPAILIVDGQGSLSTCDDRTWTSSVDTTRALTMLSARPRAFVTSGPAEAATAMCARPPRASIRTTLNKA